MRRPTQRLVRGLGSVGLLLKLGKAAGLFLASSRRLGIGGFSRIFLRHRTGQGIFLGFAPVRFPSLRRQRR